METTEVKLIFPLREQMALHTRLFKNVLIDIKTSDEQKRVNQNTNHITWLAGSLVSIRYYLGEVLGLHINDPYAHLFKHGKALNMEYDYPSLETLKADWFLISEKLAEKLKTLTSHELEKLMPDDSPMKGSSVLDALIFLSDREAYVIGQIAFIRRVFGYDAMRYN